MEKNKRTDSMDMDSHCEPASKRIRTISAIYFPEDSEALTTDPDTMKNNFRIPMIGLNEKRADGSMLPIGRDVEFIVSPDFMKRATLQGKPMLDKLQPIGTDTPKAGQLKWGAEPKLLVNGAKTKEEFIKGVHELFCLSGKNKSHHAPTQNQNASHGQRTSRKRIVTLATELTSIRLRGIETPITIGGLTSLRPDIYINDEIVDAGCMMAINACHNNNDICYMMELGWQAAFTSRERLLLKPTLNGLYARLTKQQPEIFSIKYLVWSIGRNKHWIAVIVKNPFPSETAIRAYRKQIKEDPSSRSKYAKQLYSTWLEKDTPQFLLFDSMGEDCRNNKTYDAYQADNCFFIARCLLQIHAYIWDREKDETLQNIAMTLCNTRRPEFRPYQMKVPQQLYGLDCGIFVIAYVRTFFLLVKNMGIPFDKVKALDWNILFQHDESIIEYRYNLHDMIVYKVACENPQLHKDVFEDEKTINDLLKEQELAAKQQKKV